MTGLQMSQAELKQLIFLLNVDRKVSTSKILDMQPKRLPLNLRPSLVNVDRKAITIKKVRYATMLL